MTGHGNSGSDCHCGRRRTSRCTECGCSLCERHEIEWFHLLRSWAHLRSAYVQYDQELVRRSKIAGALAAENPRRSRDWLRPNDITLSIDSDNFEQALQPHWPALLKQSGVSDRPYDAIVCLPCFENAFVRLFPAVESHIASEVRKGRGCVQCGGTAKSICAVCGAVICSKHEHQCDGCHRIWCREHSQISKTDRDGQWCSRCQSISCIVPILVFVGIPILICLWFCSGVMRR